MPRGAELLERLEEVIREINTHNDPPMEDELGAWVKELLDIRDELGPLLTDD